MRVTKSGERGLKYARHMAKRMVLCTASVLLACANAAPAAHTLRDVVREKTSPQTGSSEPSPPVFDIASIRQNNSDQHARSHIYSSPDNGSFKAVNVTLLALLRYSFGLPETQILGAPAWLNSDRYDVDAKADGPVDERLHAMPTAQSQLVKQQMLQALLADRFKLTAHGETRELPVFALIPAKGGSKLHQATTNGNLVDEGYGKFNAHGIPIAVLAEELAKQTGRVVFDKTGVQGRYDVALTWSPTDDASSATISSSPSIFVALQEQLGLKLESQKGPVQILVVDHIERPSPN